MTLHVKNIYLRNAKRGDIVARRGVVMRVLHVTQPVEGQFLLEAERLNENNDWVRESYSTTWPEDQLVIFLGPA